MTLSELRALLRVTLADEAAWADGTLDRWIGAAVRFYSAQFPRRVRTTIELAAGTQAYAIPGGLSSGGVISVEYPAGETPPRMLRCVAYGPSNCAEDAFGLGAACYAVQGVADDDTSSTGCIVFAETVQTGQTAVVEYWAPHLVPAAGDDDAVITVPDQHLEAIAAYVEFAAHYELETGEAAVADGGTMVLAQLGEESRRAWNRYKEVMDRLTWLGAVPTPYQVVWSRFGL